MMNTLMVVLTVYMAFCVPTVTSQVQTDLSVRLIVNGTQTAYNFEDIMFDRFYHCLCNEIYLICDASRENDSDVALVSGCLQEANVQSSDGFTCAPTVTGISCKRGDSPPEDTGCLQGFSIDPNATLSQQIRMTWVGVETVDMSSNRPDIVISNLQNDTFVIQGTSFSTYTISTMTKSRTTTYAVSGSLTSTPSDLTTSTLSDSVTSSPSESDTSSTSDLNTSSSSDFSTSNPSDSKESPDTNKEDDDEIDVPVVLGIVVVFAAFLLVIIIFGFVTWRRTTKTSSSTATNNNNNNNNNVDTSTFL